MYWVEWKTRKAKPARKSRELINPAAGRIVKPVFSKCSNGLHYRKAEVIIKICLWENQKYPEAVESHQVQIHNILEAVEISD